MGNKPSFMLQDEEINTISDETGFSPAQIERLYSRFTALDKNGNGSLSRQDFLAIPELAINPLCDRIVHMFFITCDDDHERINFRQFMNVLATFRSSNKSSPLTRSRNVSRHDSLNRQQEQSIMKQAPLLFDSIDPSSLSALSKHHARRSSFPDAFYDGFHHTTNQHSIHYASSSGQISQLTNGFQYLNHYLNKHNKNQHPVFREPLSGQKQKLYFMFKIYDVNNDNLIDLEDLVSILKMMVGTYVDGARIRRIAERSLREADKDYDGFINFDEFCAIFFRKDIGSLLKVTFPIHSNL